MSFPGRSLQRAWHIVDASSQTVGRLATSVAPLLKGKHKPTYRPNADCGDYVVIINAEKVRWTRFVDWIGSDRMDGWMDGWSLWHLASGICWHGSIILFRVCHILFLLILTNIQHSNIKHQIRIIKHQTRMINSCSPNQPTNQPNKPTTKR